MRPMTDDATAPIDPGDPIVTARLTLEVIPAEVLTTISVPGPDRVGWPGVGRIPVELCATMPAAMRLRQIEADPSVAAWLVRGIMVDDPTSPTGRRVVGHLGGHDRPDGTGTVEAGYTVAETDCGRGYATEAATAWFAWAHANGARRARLSTTAENDPSLAVIRRLGLTPTERVWDDDDQVWEQVFEADLPLSPAPR